MLIGITGMYAAGKDTLADFLENKGFIRRSLSDELRKELTVKGIPITRENLIENGTRLRQEEGNAVLAKRALAGAKSGTNYTYSSIRNPAEVEELRKSKDFYLIFVDAPIDTRFERAKKRNRESEPATLELFKSTEEKEYHNPNSSGQQLLKVKEMADFVINNEGTFEQFYTKIEDFLDKLNYVYRRPTWDEYFVEIAKTVAKRSTCDRGRSGCVIAKDKRLLVTGYVGAPPGMKHCDEVGHLMKKMTHEDGNESWHCVRTIHAEQNALIQAAKQGTAIEGTTIYCKMTPCRTCAMLIARAGITRVVCQKKYHVFKEPHEIFNDAGIKVEYLDDSIEKYSTRM